jgi:uncharacterized SAM-binding protein YcdF (DUF218 family)
MTIHRCFSILWRVALGALSVVLILGAAAFLFPQQVLTVDSGDVRADAMVILGGDNHRAQRGAELYREGAAPLVIVTGFGDCRTNVELLEKLGLPAGAITPEPAALTTFQNAALSVPLLRAMRVHRVILVTSWYHSRRALACFEHVAPDLTFYSRPSYDGYAPKLQNRAGFGERVNLEYVKLLDYWIVHGVCPF